MSTPSRERNWLTFTSARARSGAHAAVALVEQGDEQVSRLDELVIAPDGQAAGVGERDLEPRGQLFR